jgi:hypothetical protein
MKLIRAFVVTLYLAAPSTVLAGICLYNGDDAACDACQDRNRQQSEERVRDYNEELRRWREVEERREHWRRQEQQSASYKSCNDAGGDEQRASERRGRAKHD